MSNIFGPYCRNQAGLPLSTPGGAPTGNGNMHLYVLDGAVEAILNSESNHYGAGLPFNALGRLNVTTAAPIDYYDQGIPYSATGLPVTGAGPVDYYDQGVPFNASGQIVTV